MYRRAHEGRRLKVRIGHEASCECVRALTLHIRILAAAMRMAMVRVSVRLAAMRVAVAAVERVHAEQIDA